MYHTPPPVNKTNANVRVGANSSNVVNTSDVNISPASSPVNLAGNILSDTIIDIPEALQLKPMQLSIPTQQTSGLIQLLDSSIEHPISSQLIPFCINDSILDHPEPRLSALPSQTSFELNESLLDFASQNEGPPCVECTLVTQLNNSSIVKCFACRSPAHISCIMNEISSSIINEDVVKLIADFRGPLVFACGKCRPQLISVDASLRRDNVTKKLKAENVKLQGNIVMLENQLANLQSQLESHLRESVRQKQHIDSAAVKKIVAESINSTVMPLFEKINKSIALLSTKPSTTVVTQEKPAPRIHESQIAGSSKDTSIKKMPSSNDLEKQNQSNTVQKSAAKSKSNNLAIDKLRPESGKASVAVGGAPKVKSLDPKPQRKSVNISDKPNAKTSSLSNSKKNHKSQVKKDDLSKALAMSYAQILANSVVVCPRIRNIDITSTDDSVLSSILADPLIKDKNDVVVVKKSSRYLTIQMPTIGEAKKIEQRLKRKHNNAINVSESHAMRPQIKVVNLPPTVTADTLKAGLLDSNPRLLHAEFDVERSYVIETGKRTYVSAILNCSLETQLSVLEMGYLMFEDRKCHVFEFVNVLQCQNCFAFGHSQRHCPSPVKCKACAEDHPLSECVSTILSCVNCVKHNSVSKNKYLTDHIATSDLCQCKIERINGLKVHMAKNLKK